MSELARKHSMKRSECSCFRKETALQVKEDPTKGKHPLWTLRTKEEADAFWKAEFGSSNDSEGSEPTVYDQGAEEAHKPSDNLPPS